MSATTVQVDDTRGATAWRFGLPGLATLAVCFGFARYGYGLFLPRFQAEFGGSAGALGAVTSAGYVLGLVALGGVAWSSGRLGARWPVAFGVACAAAGMLMIGLARGPVLLAAGVAVAGTAPCWVWAPYADVVQDEVRPAGRRHALAMISTGTTFGIAVAGSVAALVPGAGWRVVWLAAAAAALVVTGWNLRVLPARPRQATEGRAKLFARPGVGRLLVAATSFGLVGAACWSFAGVAVTAGDPRIGPLLWALTGLAGAAGLAAGLLVRTQGLRRVYVAAQVVIAAASVLFGLAACGWGFAVAAAVLYGAGFMTGGALLPLRSAALFADRPTRGFSLVIVFNTLGAAAGPAAFGFVVDHAGLTTAFVLTAALALASIAVLPGKER
ncbi:MFS transporter [Amycolatopsis sp. NEAU-NG30]|uniref:MFS transporter n=1 Tax=Amycolatopsis melonis TaxID=3156488 RepID=A0ABV0LT28_9PSEU